MSWKRNDSISLPAQLQEIWRVASNTLSINTYRSRQPIGDEFFKYLNMLFSNPEIPESTYQHYKTIALPRGTDDVLIEAVRDIDNCISYHTDHNNIIIVNTSTNPGLVPLLKDYFIKHSWTHWPEFAPALTLTPVHTILPFSIVTQARVQSPIKTTVFLTNLISDELVIRLGAVLPQLYTQLITSPELTDSFLSADKQAFYTAYLDLIKDYTSNTKLRELKRSIEMMGSILNNAGVAGAKQLVAQEQQRINRIYEEYLAHCSQLKDAQISLASTYWTDRNASVVEFKDYLLSNDVDNITVLKQTTDGNVLTYGMHSKLLYWDEETYELYRTSKQSNTVTRLPGPQLALMNSIFKYKTVTVLFCTGVQINFTSGVPGRYQDLIRYDDTSIGIPHTHVHYFNCFGNNKAPITKAILNRDYLVMWEQMRAVLSGLNLSDSTVFNEFVDYYIRGNENLHFIELNDTKEVLCVRDFIKRYPTGYQTPEAPPVTIVPERIVPNPVPTPEPVAQEFEF